jgi:C-terminal processing protease CtpA/Prc
MPSPARPVPSLLLAAVMLLAHTACRENEPLKAYPDQLVGIGVVVKSEASAMVLTRVIASGPAAQAGFAEGDRLVAVDGQPIAGRTLASVVESLRGKPGSTVAVTVERGSTKLSASLARQALAKVDGNYAAAAH